MKLDRSTALTAVGLIIAATNVEAACNTDNCYRAFFPSNPEQLSSAKEFCSTYTTTINTATTGFPTRATSACGTTPVKYSSVCSCPPTPTPKYDPPQYCQKVRFTDDQIHNGEFECPDYYPWEPQVAPGTSFKLSQPGIYGEGQAFEFSQTGPAAPFSVTSQARLVQRMYGFKVGQSQLCTFSTFINRVGAGSWKVSINDNEQSMEVHWSERQGPGFWNEFYFPFKIKQPNITITFEVFTDQVGAVFKLDRPRLRRYYDGPDEPE